MIALSRLIASLSVPSAAISYDNSTKACNRLLFAELHYNITRNHAISLKTVFSLRNVCRDANLASDAAAYREDVSSPLYEAPLQGALSGTNVSDSTVIKQLSAKTIIPGSWRLAQFPEVDI